MRLHFLAILTVLLVCAACGTPAPDNAVIPTVAALPTPTETETPSPSPLPSDTPAATPSATETPTETETASEPTAPDTTATETSTITNTPGPSLTPSNTITVTPSPTPTATLTETMTPGALNSLIELALRATVLPVTAAPLPPTAQAIPAPGVPAQCPIPPSGGFAAVYFGDTTLPAQLGCPITTDANIITAVQSFERGMMLYLAEQPSVIYVMYNNGEFRRYADTWVEGVDPDSGGETPPVGLLAPVRGFGKVWRENPEVRDGLGWAVSEEAGNQSRQLLFERGRLVYLPQRNQTAAIIETTGGDTGAWKLLSGGA